MLRSGLFLAALDKLLALLGELSVQNYYYRNYNESAENTTGYPQPNIFGSGIGRIGGLHFFGFFFCVSVFLSVDDTVVVGNEFVRDKRFIDILFSLAFYGLSFDKFVFGYFVDREVIEECVTLNKLFFVFETEREGQGSGRGNVSFRLDVEVILSPCSDSLCAVFCVSRGVDRALDVVSFGAGLFAERVAEVVELERNGRAVVLSESVGEYPYAYSVIGVALERYGRGRCVFVRVRVLIVDDEYVVAYVVGIGIVIDSVDDSFVSLCVRVDIEQGPVAFFAVEHACGEVVAVGAGIVADLSACPVGRSEGVGIGRRIAVERVGVERSFERGLVEGTRSRSGSDESVVCRFGQGGVSRHREICGHLFACGAVFAADIKTESSGNRSRAGAYEECVLLPVRTDVYRSYRGDGVVRALGGRVERNGYD